MGWSSTSMAARYQHVTDPIRREVASRVGTLLFGDGDVCRHDQPEHPLTLPKRRGDDVASRH